MSKPPPSFHYDRNPSVKAHFLAAIRLILFSICASLLPCLAFAQDSANTNATAPGVNLAVVATPSSSFGSGDTTLTALNDGSSPRNSRDTRRGSYGNWPRTGTQWVEYDWSQPISTKQMDVYWWIDGGGVGAPKACRVSYWNGSAFVPVIPQGGTDGLGVTGNKFNTTTFEEVTTSKLRLEIDSDGTLSTGILEWKVYDSGKSPEFPPSVAAGIDRDVIVGGKTYLAGKVKALKPDSAAAKLTWSKAAGPGEVNFENANEATTTATFSAPGEYTIKLMAGEGQLSSSATLKVKANSPPPADRLDVVYTKRYSIDSPLWNARAKALIVNWIPHCIDYIERTNLTQGPGGIDNFIEAAKALRGEPHAAHKGYVFANAWVHQTVESMCIALMVDPKGDAEIMAAQAGMKATLEDWIPKILAAQESDGYLQTAFTARNRTVFSISDVRNASGLLKQLTNPTNAVSAFISAKLSPSTREALAAWANSNAVAAAQQTTSTASSDSNVVKVTVAVPVTAGQLEALKMGTLDFSVPAETTAAIVGDFNAISSGPSIWDEKAFANVRTRPEVQDLLARNNPAERARLNRLLLEDAYQPELARSQNSRWVERWSPQARANHEGYVAGYFIESAINHYTLTEGKDRRLYDAAKKLADCWVANIGPGKKEWYDGHQEMEQALVRFGRFVNDMEGTGHGDNYVKLAKFLLDCRRNGNEYDQSHVPAQQQYEAVGHAVRAVYSYSGMADVAAETHDLDYQSAVMSLWNSMVNKKYYVTGGVGSGETAEGFGPNYSLRNNAYCESCSSCGLIFFQYKMNIAYHDAKYADLYEETMYNALLGSTDLEGKNFYYTNPLIGGRRTAWHACPCCVGNIPRTLLMIPTWTYVKGTDGIYVNMFIGSTINVEKVAGTDIQMVQKTDYPWSGNVSITVNPKQSKNFSVYVRAPNRTTSVLYTPTPEVNGIKSLAVNGKPITPKIENGYAVITRDWKAGDKIDVVLPMEVQRVKADEHIAANRGSVALRYGPLIYNVESADQSDINQAIGAAPLTTEWRGDLLGGVLAIKGRWADGSPLLAIPNYARNNRLGVTSSGEIAAGNPAIDYSGGSTVGTTGAGVVTNAITTGGSGNSRTGGGGGIRYEGFGGAVTNAASAAAAGATTPRPNRGRGGGGSSMVWLKDQQ